MKTSILILSIFVLGGCGGSSGSLGGGGGVSGSGGKVGSGGLPGSGGTAGIGGGGITGSGGGLTGSGGTAGIGGAGGNSCSVANACLGGICTGTEQGCDGAWTCLVAGGCTADLASFCGCDAVTFHASSTCPTRPYMFKGACDLGVSCDSAQVTCSGIAPRCASGQIPSVVGDCWGQCVEIQYCRCTAPTDCPSGHSCRMGAGLCN